MQESLRISAGRGVIWRVLEKDVRLGDYVLPKGATLVAPTASIHSNPNYWPEPSKFRPERFLDAEPSASKWLPLSGLFPVGQVNSVC